MNVKLILVAAFIVFDWVVGIILLAYVVPYLWSVYAALKAAQGG